MFPRLSTLWVIAFGFAVMAVLVVIMEVVSMRHVDTQLRMLMLALLLVTGGIAFFVISRVRIGEKKILEESENRFRTMFREAPLGVALIHSYTGVIATVNPSFAKIAGRTIEEMKNIDWMAITHPDDVQEDLDNMARLNAHEISGFNMQKRYIRPDGSYVWINMTIAPMVTEDKSQPHHLCMIEDITERRQTEEALRHSQKMEAIGNLTGGFAHDFNNMLGVIMGNLDHLRRRVASDALAMEFVEEAHEGCQRGANITKRLLSFSRNEGGNPQLTNVNDFITGMKNLIAKSLTPRVKIETHLTDNIWIANVDSSDLENSILNLSLNARDAMPEGGSLVIETANKFLDNEYTLRNPGSTAGEYILVSVSDTGIGMTKEILDQVFQPLFSTKDAGKGTGLGLSMVYGFVQRSGGHIKVYSEPGRGTTFRIYLPRAVDELGEINDATAEIDAEVPRGDETILIVDDEEGLLKVATTYLTDLGYRTQMASNGKQALEMLQSNPQIDLMFSDVVMPGGMDGFDLAKEAIKNHPDLNVLLASGFTSEHTNVTNGDLPLHSKLSKNLLSKPYNQSEHALAVRRTLDGED